MRPSRFLGLGPPRGAWLGLLLTGVGLVLLGIATGPWLVGAATPLICKQDGTDTEVCFFEPEDEAGVPIASLKTADKPVDPQLAAGLNTRFIRSQSALIQLGKALFWDQQVGSDGQACGTCHFTAGADSRTRNQTSPGLKANPVDTSFQNGLGPNHVIATADFPLHKLADPNNRNSQVIRDTNDVMSSAGVFNRQFQSIQANPGGLGNDRPAFDRRAMDNCQSTADTDGFHIGNINTRRAEPRNTPTMINGLFNNRNFWDSRAQDVFNGVSPFGARDTAARVFENTGSGPQPVQIQIKFSSLASQSVGPPTNPNEMSCNGRTFPDVGHKMLTSTSTPLAQQDVSATDSVLGSISFSRATGGRVSEGLNVSYRTLVERAFQPRWWNSNATVTVPGVKGARPQIEANFSLFWGLSVGAYMETLRADDSEIDRFFDGTEQLSDAEFRGLLLFSSAFGSRPFPIRAPTERRDLFLADGRTPADLRCTACHGGPEMTAASIDAVTDDARVERMAQLPVGTTPRCGIYDAGHFDTGVRRVNDDLALGGLDPFGNSLGETQIIINAAFHGGPPLTRLVPTAVSPFGLVPGIAGTTNCGIDADNVKGTFKAPSLRNVELTGPYFHNGGELSLRQVIDFYNRGGNFQDQREFDPNVHNLNLGSRDKSDLVSFLLALTDPRVAFERAPFDHPGICVANGHPGNEVSTQAGDPLPSTGGTQTARALFFVECHPASGANGLQNRLQPFLGVNQFDATP
ncbi:MAG TPA: cytochrome c peroxidase [Chloroflexota bacterium]